MSRDVWYFNSSIQSPPPAVCAAEQLAATWSSFIKRPSIATEVLYKSVSGFKIWPFFIENNGLSGVDVLLPFLDNCGEHKRDNCGRLSPGFCKQTGGQSLNERKCPFGCCCCDGCCCCCCLGKGCGGSDDKPTKSSRVNAWSIFLYWFGLRLKCGEPIPAKRIGDSGDWGWWFCFNIGSGLRSIGFNGTGGSGGFFGGKWFVSSYLGGSVGGKIS